MSFTHNLYVDNQLDVNVDATILGTLAIGQSAVSHSSAALEIDSTTKGLLFPRMTTSERTSITTPAAGLMVYDTTKNALYYYNGSSWVIMVRNMEDDSNIIIGNNTSGDSITTGASGNVILGRDCADNYSANNSIFIGENVLEIATNSSESVIIGANSANLMTTGSIRNTSCGESSFLALTTGTRNTAIGNTSGGFITTGLNNTMIGSDTAGAATLSNQTVLGYQATSNKANQVMIGNSSVIEMVPHASANANLGTTTNPWNEIHIKSLMNVGTTLAIGQTTAIDSSAILELESTTAGLLFPRMTTAQRTAIGTPTAGLMVYDTDEDTIYYYNGTNWTVLVKNRVDNSNIILGEGSGDALTTGHLSNTIIGKDSGPVLTDDCNVLIGNRIGTLLTTSQFNVMLGADTAPLATTGDNNTIIGYLAAQNLSLGSSNTFLGEGSGDVITTGSQNVMLGSGAIGTATNNNQIAIGYNASSTKANQCLIGNSSLIECVPDAGATASLGTSTNPWNNARLNGNASVGSSTDPVASALLEMTSTSQGLLIPRMTTAQREAISSPADGLMVYDTDRRSVFIYDGSTFSWFNEVSRRRFDAYNNDFAQCVNGSWTVLTWNVERFKDADSFTHVLNSENITITHTDDYFVTYAAVYTSGGNSKVYQCRAEIDTGSGFNVITSTNIYGQSSANDATTVSSTFIYRFNAGDIIRITSQSISNSTTFTAKVNSSSITIMRV